MEDKREVVIILAEGEEESKEPGPNQGSGSAAPPIVKTIGNGPATTIQGHTSDDPARALAVRLSNQAVKGAIKYTRTVGKTARSQYRMKLMEALVLEETDTLTSDLEFNRELLDRQQQIMSDQCRRIEAQCIAAADQ